MSSPAAPNLDSTSGVPDLLSLGLVLSIVGCFLLANSIVFRHPRTLVNEFFGRQKERLTTIRSYIFHRVQIHLGFLFLLAGFGLQLFGHYRAPGAGALAADVAGAQAFPVGWVGLVLVVVVLLEFAGWWLSHMLFRRYIREYFRIHPPLLESDMALARELGELFGISSAGDDSVQSYLLRIRQRIGILGPSTSASFASRKNAEGIAHGSGELDSDEEFGLPS